jgi:hypothetical protein
LDSTSGNFPFGTVPKRAICQYWYWAGVTHLSHFRYWALPVPVRSFTGPRTGTGLYARGPISGMGLCQFRYGHSLGPVPELDSMRAVPFPVRGSASSGTDIHWAPYRNWSLCVNRTALERRERKGFSLGFGKSVRRAVLSHRS